MRFADALGVLCRAGARVGAVPLARDRVNGNEPDDIATAEAVVAKDD